MTVNFERIMGVLAVLLAIGIGYILRGSAQEVPVVISNSQFHVTILTKNTIEILENTTQKRTKRRFDFPIATIELCPTSPYLSLHADDTWFTSYLYHFHEQTLFSAPMSHSDAGRWSSDGHYTILYAGINLAIVPTEQLLAYLPLSEVSQQPEIVINGHEFGMMAPLAWIDEHTLLYETGCCDLAVYGVVDLSQGKNYFVAWCASSIGICEKTHDLAFFQTYVQEQLQQQTLQEVSFDFMNDVFALQKQNK